jgi:hypothetical protein
MAGKDITRAFGDYLTKREVSNLLFVQKGEGGFRIVATAYNEKKTVIDDQQPAWSRSNSNLNEALKELYGRHRRKGNKSSYQ